MIFFLIAGTATPAFLLATRGALGLACVIVMWELTLTAAAIRMAWMHAPEVVVGTAFVGLGWVAGLALPGVWIHAGAAPGGADARGWPALHGRGDFPTIVAGPARTRRCSATTRSFTPACAPPRRATTPR